MTDDTRNTELLPCPFCGGEAYHTSDYTINCADCGASRSAQSWNKRAALSMPPPAIPDGWQPIETAPRDGTPLLLLYGEMPIYGLNMNGVDKDGNDIGPTWFAAPTGQYYGEPTHWMPLPKPPKPTDTKDGE